VNELDVAEYIYYVNIGNDFTSVANAMALAAGGTRRKTDGLLAQS